jgi:hypothetical protein
MKDPKCLLRFVIRAIPLSDGRSSFSGANELEGPVRLVSFAELSKVWPLLSDLGNVPFRREGLSEYHRKNVRSLI